MSGVDIEKARQFIAELKLLDQALKVRTYSGSTRRVLADNRELSLLTLDLVLPWMIRGTHQLSTAGRKQLHETIREIELEIS